MNSPSDSSDPEYAPNADYLKPITAAFRRARALQQTLHRPCSLVEIRSSTQRSLLLPAGFARDMCPPADQKIILEDSEKRKWPAYWKAGVRPKVSCGFRAFARANRVQSGDVCVLEVIKEGFLVHVFKDDARDHENDEIHESKIKVEDCDLAESSRKGAQRRRRKKSSSSRDKEEDGDGHLRITFDKDPASGELKFRLKGLVPLDVTALEKLKGPFTSGQALLKALFLEA